jgi:Ca2+-binding EF-hand superfamily protein
MGSALPALPQVVIGSQHPAAPSGASSEAEFSADVLAALSGVLTKLSSRPDCRISAYRSPLQTVVEVMRDVAPKASPQPAPTTSRTQVESEDSRIAGDRRQEDASSFPNYSHPPLHLLPVPVSLHNSLRDVAPKAPSHPAPATTPKTRVESKHSWGRMHRPGVEIVPGVEIIAATLHFNSMSPEDGYNAFDVDKDGRISRTDMRVASQALSLDLDSKQLAALFEALDLDKSGAIDRGEWNRVLRQADGAKVLERRRSKHLDAADQMMAAASQKLQAGDVEGAHTLRAQAEQELALAGEGIAGESDDGGKVGESTAWSAGPGGVGERVQRDQHVSRVTSHHDHAVDQKAMRALQASTDGSVVKTFAVRRSAKGAVGLRFYRDGADESGPLVVSEVLPGSPAAQSGLVSPGETIQEINARSVDGLSVPDVAKLLQGAPRSEVFLTIGMLPALSHGRGPADVQFVHQSTFEHVTMDEGAAGAAARGDEHLSPDRELLAPMQHALDTISAALVYNKLGVSKGYAAFDVDKDGLLSLADLLKASKGLDLGIAAGDLEEVFGYMASLNVQGGDGYITKGAWEEALGRAQAQRVLRRVLPPTLMHTIDKIAEVILFNGMEPEKGFEAFDVDNDGLLSMSDLSTACSTLSLEGVTATHVEELFAFLDQDGNGSVDQQEWAAVVRHASLLAHSPQPRSSTPTTPPP